MSELSLLGLAEHLAHAGVEIHHVMHHAMEEACVVLEESAKGAMGTYEFGWPPLKPSTIARKATGDSPLLETGELKESITHVAHEMEGWVGTNDYKAAWLEFGTSKMPPRPFLGGALNAKGGELRAIFGKAMTAMVERI